MKRLKLFAVTLFLALLAVGCQKDSDAISIFPTEPGTTWIYEGMGDIDTDPVIIGYQVLDPIVVEGRRLLRIERKEPDALTSISYYEIKGDTVTRVEDSLGDQSKPQLRWLKPETVPATLKVGQEWTEPQMTYRVVGIRDVEVRAGRFPRAYVVEMLVQNSIDTSGITSTRSA